MSFDKELEKFVFKEILSQYHLIKKWSGFFNVDPLLIVSIIYIERIQYKLNTIRSLAKNIILKFEDLANKFLDNQEVSEFLNISKGFSHIKFNTAKYLARKYRDIFTSLELGTYPDHIDICIKFSCAIIREHILMWEPFVYDIRNKIDILATLYNISDFVNKKPHNNPQCGGSVLPCIIDGIYIEGLCFGDRVKKVYTSKMIQDSIST